MQELVTARQFARDTGRPARTVQQWAERGEVTGVQKVGKAWVAPRTAWVDAAAMERRVGRKSGAKS